MPPGGAGRLTPPRRPVSVSMRPDGGLSPSTRPPRSPRPPCSSRLQVRVRRCRAGWVGLPDRHQWAPASANTGIANTIVAFEIYDGAGNDVYNTYQSGIWLGTSAVIFGFLEGPRRPDRGEYRLVVAVFNAGWSSLLSWINSAGTIDVSGGSPPAIGARCPGRVRGGVALGWRGSSGPLYGRGWSGRTTWHGSTYSRARLVPDRK